ncbi:hypothetical protein SAMN04487969_110149 [Paenibacillus algorifonticola]|uniref:Polyprenyl synthetase n=1 Tax=Paenibacillus algorifonticola TaxID=684063 RepID=A0A1I2EXU7_9BACL|nr:hypothetical protein [Paenibacillus algorifonticola]SFE97954.1 hypothetical protein SAMN04487969_110149 [Paenibacillus algorifonticola]
MSYITPFESSLQAVFTKAQRITATFPEPLNQTGQAYITHINPLHRSGDQNYIGYLLPYWMTEMASVTKEQCEQLALANLFGMLHFFIVDEVMDTGSRESRQKLALSHLFYTQMYGVLHSMHTSDSKFWEYYDRYLADWSIGVAQESADDYFNTDPLRTALKSSLVKIASTGALLLSGQHAFIPAVEQAVDYVLVALQMADDWTDWEADLADGSYNGLLALFRDKWPEQSPITVSKVRKAIYVQGLLTDYAKLACQFEQAHLELGLKAGHLFAFHASITASLANDARNIDLARQKQMEGGLFQTLT